MGTVAQPVPASIAMLHAYLCSFAAALCFSLEKLGIAKEGLLSRQSTMGRMFLFVYQTGYRKIYSTRVSLHDDAGEA